MKPQLPSPFEGLFILLVFVLAIVWFVVAIVSLVRLFTLF